MASKSTLKIASQLLDRFFRDAEGRTNRQIDVYFALEDMGVPTDKATPALDYLKSRGLLNLFGTDIGFLTEKGIEVVVEESDLSALPKESKSFIQKPVAPEPAEAEAPAARPTNTPRGSPRPKRAQLTHIDLEGAEFTLPLAQCCRVGRADDNEVRINDKRASKHHAEIVFDRTRYLLVDLESANGTLLNGDYALEPIELKHDDEIVIGRTMLLYQAPKVVPAPEAVPAPQKAEPATVISGERAQAPTERPAPNVPTPVATPSIRVVKGTPAAPPSGEQPSVPRASSADLFAEPPTAAPSSDLFAEPATAAPSAGLFAEKAPQAPAPVAPSDSLFDDDPPTQVPDRPAGAPSGDLFDDGPTAGGATPAAAGNLFEEVAPSTPPALQADDLFADAQAVTPAAAAPLVTPAKDDLFTDGPPASATPLPAIDPGKDLQLEPAAEGATLAPTPADPIGTLDTVAQAPADTATPANPDVEDLWEGDVTPQSGQPALLDNPPVQLSPEYDKTVDTPPKDDASTLMMDRESLLSEVEIIEDLPPWTSDTDSETAHPPYSDPSEMPRAPEPATPSAPDLAGEDLPEASPSMVLEAAPRPQAGLPEGIAAAESEAEALEETADATEPHPEFYALLSGLKKHARDAELPDRGALIEAIERLESHPYVRLALREL